jgi:hypothetical protein
MVGGNRTNKINRLGFTPVCTRVPQGQGYGGINWWKSQVCVIKGFIYTTLWWWKCQETVEQIGGKT